MIAVFQQPSSQGDLKYAFLVLQSPRQVKSPRHSLMTPGLSKHQSIFKLFLTHERVQKSLSEAQELKGYTKHHWTSFQPASGISKETMAHYLIFYVQWVCVSSSVYLLDKTVLQDNTRLTTVSEIPTQPQQGSCTVYIMFYILFQLHLYLITMRTKNYTLQAIFIISIWQF